MLNMHSFEAKPLHKIVKSKNSNSKNNDDDDDSKSSQSNSNLTNPFVKADNIGSLISKLKSNIFEDYDTDVSHPPQPKE